MLNINPISSAVDLKAYFKVNEKKASAETAKGTATNSEVVELSAVSDDVQSVKGAVASLPEIRIEKVDEIKKKIKQNDYPLENRFDEALKKLWSSNILA